MTVLDLTALEWKSLKILCFAVADAMEKWRTVFLESLHEREKDEVARLISCLRIAQAPAAKQRLRTKPAEELKKLEGYFKGKSLRFACALHAARVGLACVGEQPVASTVFNFQRCVDQTGLINVWNVFAPWRVCDAFGVWHIDEIPVDARAAFEAIWLASEYRAAYDFAASWRAAREAA